MSKIIDLPQEGVKWHPLESKSSSGKKIIDLPKEGIEWHEPQSESILGSVGRNIKRGIARGVENVLGIGGAIEAPVRAVLDAISPKKPGTNEPVYRQKPVLPTAEDVKEQITRPLLGEETDPQGSAERFFDDVISYAVPSLIGGPGSLASKAVRGLASATAATGTQRALEAYEAPEWLQGLGSLGAGAATSFIGLAGGKKSLEKAMNSYYEQAEKALESSRGLQRKTSIKALSPILNQVESAASKGKLRPQEKQIFDYVSSIKNKASKNGFIDAADLWAFKRQLNEDLGDPNKLRGIEKQLGKLRTGVTDLLKNQYGKENPAFGKALEAADQIYAGIHDANRVSSFLNKHLTLKNLLKGSPAGYLLYSHPGKAAGAIGTAYGAKSFLNGVRYLKQPAIRKYYSSFVENALKDNVVGAERAIKNLVKATDHYG